MARGAHGPGLMGLAAGSVLVLLLAAQLGAEPPVLTEENLQPVKPAPTAPGSMRAPAAKAQGDAGARPAADKQPNPAQESPSVNPLSGADFSYVVRAGDSLSSIASLFHVETSDLMRLNRVTPETVLQVGQPLRIPNPFAAQVRELTQNISDLNRQLQQARSKIGTLEKEVRATSARSAELVALNRALQHDVRVLPWWRTLALSTGGATAVMLIVTLLTVLEWRRLRARVLALVEANESLRRLDHKYRLLLAKAELRLQQIYGRRRGSELESADSAKTPEEFEIERYNQELKQLLEAELVRLGLAPPGNYKRSRLREILAGSSAPAPARWSRR
jgi:LysM repeat protein